MGHDLSLTFPITRLTPVTGVQCAHKCAHFHNYGYYLTTGGVPLSNYSLQQLHVCVGERPSDGWPYSMARIWSCEEGGLSSANQRKPSGPRDRTRGATEVIPRPPHTVRLSTSLCVHKEELIRVPRPLPFTNPPHPPPTPSTLRNEPESGPCHCIIKTCLRCQTITAGQEDERSPQIVPQESGVTWYGCVKEPQWSTKNGGWLSSTMDTFIHF